MREANEHPAPEEIWRVLLSSAGAEKPGLEKELQEHIDHCPQCAQIKEDYITIRSRLYELGRAPGHEAQNECSASATWVELATGLLPRDETLERLKHASSCPACAEELMYALQATASSEPAPPDILQHLESGTEGWQHALAAQMASRAVFPPADMTPKVSSSRKKIWLFAPRQWAYAGLAAALALAVGIGLFSYLRPSSPQKLIAIAYSQQRTVDLRIPGAGYGPIKVERANGQSQLNSPQALLEAEALIKQGLEKTPDDPNLLREKAEADLLNRDYQPAIETLNHALRLQPNSFYLLVDLATAQFERAEATSSPADYEAGLQYLGDAIRMEPNNPVGLFNRAIIYERLYLYDRAIADWEQFLKVETDPGWKKEGEQRLQQLRQREQKRSSRHVPERLTLAQFKEDLKTRQATGIEEYLEVAERQILPKISAATDRDENYQTALALANELKFRHSDQFLTDMLLQAGQPDSQRAMKLLGQSSSANHSGHHDEAYTAAAQAAAIFQKSGNVAGALASRFEQTYALQFESKADLCQALAGENLGAAQQHSYAVLEVQLLLEQAICSNMNRQVGPAKELTQRVLRTAKSHDYQSLYLRGMMLLATLESDAGNESSAWSAIHEGLGLYWNSNLPAVRAYSFYVALDFMAERLGHPNVRFAAAFEALGFRSESSNRLVEASERMRLADAALRLGEVQVAESQFREAQQIFANAPQAESVRWHELEARISLAQVEALRGANTAEITANLLASLPEVEQLSNRYVEFQYYDTLADLEIRSGDAQSGQQFLGQAIRIAEGGLRSLPTWRERLAWIEQHRQPYIMLTQLQLRAGNQQSALNTWEHFRTTTTGALLDHASVPPKLVTASEVQLASQKQIFSETRTLTYAFTPDGLMIWVRRPSEIHSVYLSVSPKDLRRTAENFIGECARPDSDMSNLRADAQYLYTWLIQPVRQWLPASGHMIIEPDGILGVVPMEALIDPAGAYFGTSYTVTVASSVQASDSASDTPNIRASDHALIASAPTSTDGSLDPPPGAMEEADRVAEKFIKPTVLAGGEAKISRVGGELGRSVIFHFAGHSGLSHDGAAMLMADGPLGPNQARVFDAHQLSTLKLAVFSACGTAKPSETSESDSLVSEFLQAGAHNVLASRWNVDSMATADFVELFYSSLLSGGSVADAVQTAADSFRRKPERAHPYYWAAFSAFGRA
ncbi:MAG TPA: CHAT domain-containing tetratricopeptide repeat protein [Terriglobales bacterium]|nr:CHAT domain-containing tetratricopeptide repeat protein [Terriglobales bacterium]